MKKTAVVLLLFLIILILPKKTFSQEQNFNTSLENYTNNMQSYNRAHDDYVLARAQYLKFKTLKSQNEAYAATLNLLQARDDVIISYMEALQAKLGEVGGLDEDILAQLTFDIDQEIEWFKEHKAKLLSSGDLGDLVEDSNEAASRYESDMAVIYKILAYIPKGRINVLYSELDTTNQKIKGKVDEIKAEDRSEYQFDKDKLDLIDQWLFESENSLIRTKNKLDDVQEIIDKIGERRRLERSSYNSAVEVLRESIQLLKEARSFSTEVINEIKRIR